MSEIKEDNRVFRLLNGDEIYIKDPSVHARHKSESEGTKAYYQALEDGCKMRSEMIAFLREKGIWSDEKDTEVAEYQKEMSDLLEELDAGGIDIEEAKKKAIRVVQLRNLVSALLAEKIQYLTETVEAKKRAASFDYLVYACTVYNNMRTKNYFGSYDDFLNKKDTDDVELIQAKCSEIFYGLPDLDDTPEKQFLKDYGFVDDQMRLVNDDGHLVDVEGRLINDQGQYIKYVGRGDKKRAVIVDIDGNEIKEKKKKPFLGKDGKPVKPKNKNPENQTSEEVSVSE